MLNDNYLNISLKNHLSDFFQNRVRSKSRKSHHIDREHQVVVLAWVIKNIMEVDDDLANW